MQSKLLKSKERCDYPLGEVPKKVGDTVINHSC